MDATMEMYRKRLARGQATYTEGKEAAKTAFGPKDKGTYKLQLLSIDIDDVTTTNGNVLVAKIQHSILDGPNEADIGEVIYDSLFLEGTRGEEDRTDEFINRFFNNLGYEAPDNKAELPEAFASLVGVAPIYIAKVTLTKDELYNRVRIIRPCDDETEQQAPPQQAPIQQPPVQQAPVYQQPAQQPPLPQETVVDPNLTALVEFGTAFGLDLSQVDLAGAIAELSKYPWDFTQLQPAEVDLLERVGLGDKITNRPAPAPTPTSAPVQRRTPAPAQAASAQAAPAGAKKGGGLRKRT